ncbi:MAG: hypothetical protein AB1486_16215 [Planctomycetota bacterium]
MSRPAMALPLLLVVTAIAGSCSRATEGGSRDLSYADASISELTNLGFLGAGAHGATRAIQVRDPERPDQLLYPGGVVIRELQSGSPLAAIGIESGDVLIRVLEDYLPAKEDPVPDLLKRIEAAYTAGKTSIALGYLRDGASRSATLILDPERLPPLNQGDLAHNARFSLAATKGLEFLRGLQQEDGSLPAPHATPNSTLAVTAIGGLAFLSGQMLPSPDAWTERASKALEFVKSSVTPDGVDHLGASFATLFLAEAIHKNQDISAMAPLGQAVGKIIGGQQEDGGWRLGSSDSELGYSERTLATHFCLLALGAAERAGLQLDNTIFEKACAYLKKHTNNGSVGFVPEPGFDRRSEAGRLTGILAALRCASCDFTDLYMQKLLKYSSGYSLDLPYAPLPEWISLFSEALLARQMGFLQWNLFTQQQQVLLLSLQKLDGSFTALPKSKRVKLPFFDDCDGPAWRTAVYTLVFLLPQEGLPLLTGSASATPGRRRDSDGKLSESPAAEAGAAPPGAEAAQMFQINSVEEAIEMLKKMGFDDDSPEMKQIKEIQEKMGKKDK